MDKTRDFVRQKYGEAISRKSSCCGDSSCCGGSLENSVDLITDNLYEIGEGGLPEELFQASFGCGNPTALAELKAGERVLDLGSGSGLDVFLSAKRVGPQGKVFGLDMTDEMLAAAEKNRKQLGVDNVEFLKGYIENIPIPDNSIDVIISNCVINLSTDKKQVLQEAFRVLENSGRLAISDIVLMKLLPAKIQEDLLAWSGCIAGALLKSEYEALLKEVGFEEVSFEVTKEYDLTSKEAQSLLQNLSTEERKIYNGSIVSAFIRAKKPVNGKS